MDPVSKKGPIPGAQGLNFEKEEPLLEKGVRRSAQGVFTQRIKSPEKSLLHRVKLFNELGLKLKLFGAKIACIFLEMKGKEVKERRDCKTFEDFKSNPVLYIKLKEWMKSTHCEENLTFLEKADAFIKNPSQRKLEAVISLVSATNLENQQTQLESLESDISFEDKKKIVSELFNEMNEYLASDVFSQFQPA